MTIATFTYSIVINVMSSSFLSISIYNTHCIHHSTDNYLYMTSYTYTYISFIYL